MWAKIEGDMRTRCLLLSTLLLSATLTVPAADRLSDIEVLAGDGNNPAAEIFAAHVLVEEMQRRTGLEMQINPDGNGGARKIHLKVDTTDRTLAPEGFRLEAASEVFITAADARGLLYGVGAYIRRIQWRYGDDRFGAPFTISSAPVSKIRGHQLGYRATANSYDAWSVAQYEQYIRELTFFGVNSIENIPFQDTKPSPHMKVDRREMNRAISAICKKYSLDYWVWTPADFDLKDQAKRTEMLAQIQQLYADSATLTGVFVPGGDPGSNPPDLVMAFLADTSKALLAAHPKAKLWLSLQGFDAAKEDFVYDYIAKQKPTWLGGIVVGPSSPPVARTRERLPANYGIRLYPDITHNKISQFQVPAWDQAYALTLGREAINPRPAEYAAIHNRYAPYSEGFISYSDGIHDDVNKIIFSALALDPNTPVREILRDYANAFFSPRMAYEIADGILALERNWRGPLVNNGGVEATLQMWQALAARQPSLENNWRWQMCLLRANYDAFLRRKLIHSQWLEDQWNRNMLSSTGSLGGLFTLTTPRFAASEDVVSLSSRIEELGEKLFQSIGLQSSVERYHASGAERGAILDFLATPLNNEWWLEDEIGKITKLPNDEARRKRLHELATWENPGPGSYYDDIGNIAKSPHVDGDLEDEPGAFHGAEPMFWWLDQGRSRLRLSWQSTMWPRQMVYEALDPKARYIVRSTGQGQCLLSIDGKRIQPRLDGKQLGDFKEFPVPAEAIKDRRLVLTFEIPKDEGHLNWRQRSRLAEVWLLKQE